MFRHLVVLYRLRQAKSAVYLLAFWSSHPHAAQVHCHAKFASIRNLNAIKDRPARRLDFPSALSVVLGPTSPHHSPDNAGAKGTEKAKKSEKIAKSCFSQPNYASTVLNLHCERLLSIDKSFAKIVCTTILQNVSLFNGMSTVNKVSEKKGGNQKRYTMKTGRYIRGWAKARELARGKGSCRVKSKSGEFQII